MSYDAAIVQRASARLARRKEIRERRRWDLEQELYRRQPRLRELDRAIGGTMAELAGLAISGKPIQADGPEIADIRRRNLELQAQRAELSNHANIITLGAQVTGIELAKCLVKEYLSHTYDPNSRSAPKVQRICDYEQKGE